MKGTGCKVLLIGCERAVSSPLRQALNNFSVCIMFLCHALINETLRRLLFFFINFFLLK